jgi:U6 snRNA-associated Sm-like protein LSm7
MTSIGLNIRIPKESLIKLSHHENQELVVRFNGGRELHGKLKSWDKIMNLILDNCYEVMGVEEKEEIKRELGLVIVKGSQI